MDCRPNLLSYGHGPEPLAQERIDELGVSLKSGLTFRHGRIRWHGGLLAVAIGCSDAESRDLASTEYRIPAVYDVSYGTREDAALFAAAVPQQERLGDWCARSGANDNEQGRAMVDVALAYAAVQGEHCARLTADMSSAQFSDWEFYLTLYTHVMSGCQQLLEPPRDGIRAFGLANTAAVGLLRPPLSRGDAGLLIADYVPLLAAALHLDMHEGELVEAHLWNVAGREIDPEGSNGPSVCAEP